MATLNILLVEDNPSWKSILEDKLHYALDCISNDCFIKIVETFDEAYDDLKGKSWHLLVTDIGLGDSSTSPQKLGTQLVSLAHHLHIPAIAVSGTPVVTKSTVRDLILEYGASDFFSKEDFDAKEFIGRVQELLRANELQGKNIETSEAEKSVSGEPLALETSLPIVSSTYGKRRRLEQERDDLQSEWDVQREKIKQLRMNLVIEAGAAIKFQLEKELSTEEARIAHLERKLSVLDSELELFGK